MRRVILLSSGVIGSALPLHRNPVRRRLLLLSLTVLFLVGALLTGQAPTASGLAVLAGTKGGSCQLEVAVGGRHYRPVHLPRWSVVMGSRFPTSGFVQCEPELRCPSSGQCSVLPGRVAS